MERSTIALAVGGIVVVVAAGIGGAVALGVVPTDSNSPPQVNETSSGNSSQAFVFEVNGTEKCGKQCRRMTVTVANTGDVAAENVTLDMDVYAGKADPVWEGTHAVGRLGAGTGKSMQLTITVDDEGYHQIVSNFGKVTLQTTVESRNASNSFEDTHNVA
ncbi:MAG: hypothetical protein ABEI77_07755 [Halorientalis sp.]